MLNHVTDSMLSQQKVIAIIKKAGFSYDGGDRWRSSGARVRQQYGGENEGVMNVTYCDRTGINGRNRSLEDDAVVLAKIGLHFQGLGYGVEFVNQSGWQDENPSGPLCVVRVFQYEVTSEREARLAAEREQDRIESMVTSDEKAKQVAEATDRLFEKKEAAIEAMVDFQEAVAELRNLQNSMLNAMNAGEYETLAKLVATLLNKVRDLQSWTGAAHALTNATGWVVSTANQLTQAKALEVKG